MDKQEYYTLNYLQKLFKAYYKQNAKDILIPDLDQRELAFTSWRRPGMNRHIGYPSKNFLIEFLEGNGPSNAYRSAAYYGKPGSDTMDTKKYRKCDFVFDIDSDHIPTDCREKHNFFICKSCNHKVAGVKPLKCPECGHNKFKEIVWICDECLEVTKRQVEILVDDFLLPDFHIPLQDIRIFFSGHRGYHLHINSEFLLDLDSDARREMIDYITGEGFSFKIWEFEQKSNDMRGFNTNQFGWPQKISKKLMEILQLERPEFVRTFSEPTYRDPLYKSIINTLWENRELLFRKLKTKDQIWQIQGIGEASWHKIFYILRDLIKSDVDIVVSYDLHRLIRMEGSINGKCGLRKIEVPYEGLADFDPLKDALSFPSKEDNTLRVEIVGDACPKLRIGSQSYGPYGKGEIKDLPLNVALFLLCKKVAMLDHK